MITADTVGNPATIKWQPQKLSFNRKIPLVTAESKLESSNSNHC